MATKDQALEKFSIFKAMIDNSRSQKYELSDQTVEGNTHPSVASLIVRHMAS